MDFDIHIKKKNYQLQEVKAALKLNKLRGQAHPLAGLKKAAPKKQEEADEQDTIKVTEMKTGFDPLSMLKQSEKTLPKKTKQPEEKKEMEEAPEVTNTAIEDKVKEEREKYEKLQEQVTAMKRVEFMEWNAVKEKAISGKLLAIGQDDSKKNGGDDGTIMMYMGEEDPEATQELETPVRMGQGKSRLQILDKRRAKYKTYHEKKMTMTLREFKSQIKQLHKDMLRAWQGENRVAALKITIQCGKLLADPNPLALYPLKFFAVVDILDSFGILVFDRLKKLSNLNPGEAVVPSLVPVSAKDICQNWFLKVSCIRQLVPRLYLQISLANSRAFRKENAQKRELPRLARSIRGVGDPVIASYLAMFLTKIGYHIDVGQKDYLFVLLEVLMEHWKRASMIGHPKMTTEKYLALFEPALNWVLQALGFNSKPAHFRRAVEVVYERDWGCPLFLKLITRYFPPEIVDTHLNLINQLFLGPHVRHPQHTLEHIRDVAKSLALVSKHSKERVTFLNVSWKRLKASEDPLVYMDTCVPLTELVQKTMKSRQMNVFLQEVLKSFRSFIAQHETNERLQERLERLVMSVIMTSSHLSELSTIEHLMPLLDYFKLDVKRRLCEMIMVFFTKQEGKLTDAYYIHTLLSFAKILHSAVTSAATTSPDQAYLRSFAEKMCEIIDKVDFGKDLERQLEIYTEARPLNIDMISIKLVEKVLSLAMKALALVKGRHSRKTLGFVKACIAFAHITIPVLSSLNVQNRLYRLTAQVALMNTLISEADSLLKAIINNLQTKLEQDRKNQYKTEIDVCDTLSNILGLLIIIPSNPEVSFFKIAAGVLSLLQEHDWTIMGLFRKMKVLCALISYISTECQDSLPYHITGVDSNDAIFVGDQEFHSQARQLMSDVIDQMMKVCTTLRNDEQAAQTYSIGEAYLDFANNLADNLELNAQLKQFVQKLVQFADKQQASPEYLTATKSYLKSLIPKK